MVKKGFAAILVFCMCIICVITPALAADQDIPGVQAPAYVLMDIGSGQVIAGKNETGAYNVGSMSKTMSLLLFYEAIQNGTMSAQDTLQISANAADVGGLSAFLDAGENCTVEKLLSTVAMASSNDACIALAEKVAGSEEAFVAKMNARAAELGMSATQFVNSTGYNAEGQTTTASDMAVLAGALAQMPGFASQAKVYMDMFVHESGRETELVNPNRLVRFYENCDGLHVGSSASGGYSAAISASKSGMRLIAIVLGVSDTQRRFDDARALLEHGFANYTSVHIVKAGDVVKKNIPIKGAQTRAVKAVAKQDLALLLPKGEADALEKAIEIQEDLEAPLAEGQEIGVLKVTLPNQIIEVPLTVQDDIGESDLGYYFKYIIGAYY